MRFDLKPNQRRRTVLLALAAALVLASAACSPASTPAPLPALRPTNTPASTATPTPTRTPVPLPTLTPTPTATPPYPITTVAAGETLALGDLVLTVAPFAGAAPAAQPGRQLVLLDLAIQNVGERLVSINAARDLVLKDGADRFYKINPAAVAAIRGTTPDVDMTPGETVRAQVGFDVPAEARDLTLSFAADRFAAGRIFVRLPAAPPETPAEAAATTAVLTATAILTATLPAPAIETSPTPTATATVAIPSPTAPPASANVAVALLEPNDADMRSGSVTFRWSVADGSLPAGQAYEVVFYQAGQDPLQDGYGLAAPVVATSVQVDLAGLDVDPNFPLEPGPYLWGVRLVEQGTGRPLGMAAEGRRLIFQRASAPTTPPPTIPPPTPTTPPPTPTTPPPTPTTPPPTPTTPPPTPTTPPPTPTTPPPTPTPTTPPTPTPTTPPAPTPIP